MAKITAVIDIGSNSARLAVYEKSSRFAFHLIYEIKSAIKISEGCYINDNILQPIPMQRAINVLEEFMAIAKSLKARKILCVATSALRDAKNQKQFLLEVKQKLKLNIKIINGEKEAHFGAVAVINLLPKIETFVTIDIGGGSTELALIKNNKIIKKISLNIGTIRVKELIFDKNLQNDLNSFLENEFSKLKNDFNCDTVVGIGGSIRAISKLIMKKNLFPLKSLHSFYYDTQTEKDFIGNLKFYSDKDFKKIGLKNDRLDTIREGSAIFFAIIERLKVKKVITSGVGIREGVYLSDLLRNSNLLFPQNFNPSVRNLIDRFIVDKRNPSFVAKTANKIFETLKIKFLLDLKLKKSLLIACKLTQIGANVNFYSSKEHSFYFLLNSLAYGFTPNEKLLIALLTKYQGKKLPKENLELQYLNLLPKFEQIEKLNFILTLSLILNENLSRSKFSINLVEDRLIIETNSSLYLASNKIKTIQNPFNLNIEILQKESFRTLSKPF